MRTETQERIQKWFQEGVSLAGITSLIYIEGLEEGKHIQYMLLIKLVEKELCRIKQKRKVL